MFANLSSQEVNKFIGSIYALTTFCRHLFIMNECIDMNIIFLNYICADIPPYDNIIFGAHVLIFINRYACYSIWNLSYLLPPLPISPHNSQHQFTGSEWPSYCWWQFLTWSKIIMFLILFLMYSLTMIERVDMGMQVIVWPSLIAHISYRWASARKT